MKNKYVVFVNFCAFQRLVENKFNIKIWTFQSGRGVELDNMTMLSHFYSSSISFHKSFSEIPQQNGVAQQKHTHIIEMVSTFLLGATLPSNFWVEVTYHVFYTIKRLSSPNFQGFSHFQILFHRPPGNNFLRIIGCECFPNMSSRVSNKLLPGYASISKGYRFLDPKTGCVHVSRHIAFHELVFPYATLCCPSPISQSSSSFDPLVVTSPLFLI